MLWSKNKRYKVLYGGRGSGKSWSVGIHLVLRAYEEKIRVLCTREIQSSIRDSVHKLLSDTISHLGLDSAFVVQRDGIFGANGSEFLFKGLRHNISEIKSTEGLDVVWVEEAEKVGYESWEVLIPTIRKPNSEIIVSFNPDDAKSSTYTRFVEKEGKPVIVERGAVALMNYRDNDWFPEVLRMEMEYDKRTDFEKYEHVWMGKPKKYGDACIFKGKIFIEDFETPEGSRFFFGADFGFSQDPTCLVRCWINEIETPANEKNIQDLMIDYEGYGIGVEIRDHAVLYDTVPESRRWRIVGDSSRPETISHIRQDGFSIDGAKKGQGSVADGIEYLRSFRRIYINPRCKGSIGDFSNYKWKVDRNTNEILPIPVDASNHSPDAVRYALEDYIRSSKISVTDL